MKTIELTDEERSAVIQLIDLAVQNPAGGGLKVAGAANYISSKFADAPVNQEQGQGPDLEILEAAEPPQE
jgi:hypothetical protein